MAARTHRSARCRAVLAALLAIAGSLLPLPAIPRAHAEDALPGLRVVPEIDLERYQGTWYEVGRLPFKYQEQCVGDVTATYALLEDGRISVTNRCREEDGGYSVAEGRAKRADEDGPATRLKVRFAPRILSFLPFVWGDYWIIDLAPDYAWSVVGEPGRRYIWILSRAPALDDSTFQGIVDRATAQGYDLATLIRTPQPAATSLTP